MRYRLIAPALRPIPAMNSLRAPPCSLAARSCSPCASWCSLMLPSANFNFLSFRSSVTILRVWTKAWVQLVSNADYRDATYGFIKCLLYYLLLLLGSFIPPCLRYCAAFSYCGWWLASATALVQIASWRAAFYCPATIDWMLTFMIINIWA